MEARVLCGDARADLSRLGVRADLVFSSPPYAGKRGAVSPDAYVEWFIPVLMGLSHCMAPAGSVALNLKECVARSGRYAGERHPYVHDLIRAFRGAGWKLLDEYIWHKPNAMPGRFGPRTKDAFERVLHFSRVALPFVDVAAVRRPYKTSAQEIARRVARAQPRVETVSGFSRDRARTFRAGGADPGNVISLPQCYNQHSAVAGRHDALMPEDLARFFVRLLCPAGGLVLDPFTGSGTTGVVAVQEGRNFVGLELKPGYVELARDRIQGCVK